MKKLSIATICGMALCSLFFASPQALANSDIEIVFASMGGVSLVSIPQTSPGPGPGLLATRVELRSDPGTKLVTFENIAFEGMLVQQGINFFGTTLTTPFVDNAPTASWSLMPADWQAADSHLNISPDMVAGGAGGSHGGITEANDGSDPSGISSQLSQLNGAPPISGLGDIAMADPTDAFFVGTDLQTNVIDFAYLVTVDDGTPDDNVAMTLGVLGDGIIDSGPDPGAASFGFRGNAKPLVPFGEIVPEPTTGLMAGLASLALLGFRRRLIG